MTKTTSTIRVLVAKGYLEGSYTEHFLEIA
jgi:hypothetical protein